MHPTGPGQDLNTSHTSKKPVLASIAALGSTTDSVCASSSMPIFETFCESIDLVASSELGQSLPFKELLHTAIQSTRPIHSLLPVFRASIDESEDLSFLVETLLHTNQ